MNDLDLPQGFQAAGANLGVKNSKPDCGLLLSDCDAVWSARLTQNRFRAANVDRIDRLRQSQQAMRALMTVSGNANALTGEEGVADDECLAQETARLLSVAPEAVLTAYTGVIGHRLPVAKVTDGLPQLAAALTTRPEGFARAILTTDRVTKIRHRDLFIDGRRVRVSGLAKGSGMVAPALATTFGFIMTDAVVGQDLWQDILRDAVDASFARLMIDGDMSTNDLVLGLANGRAGHDELASDKAADLLAAVTWVCDELAREVAADGEGATRRLLVEVNSAPTEADAKKVAQKVAGSVLVKAAAFGADPNLAGRVAAAAGGALFETTVDASALQVKLQDVVCVEDGVWHKTKGAALKRKLEEPEVHIQVNLGAGSAQAWSYGCDLSYDYVKINADYAALTETSEGQVKVNERLAELGPSIKKKVLIESLRYIERFVGMRAVIKLGGAAMVDPKLEQHFAEDVLLLQSVGLKPVVVHGGGPEISRAMKQLDLKPRFIDGLRVTDPEAMDVVEMVLTGRVNQRLVAALNRTQERAVGLSGKDGALVRVSKYDGPHDLGRVGQVEHINVRLLELLENEGYVPVISPVGLGPDGESYNVNADVVAAEIARALNAQKLIFLSDVPGLLDGEDVVSELSADQLRRRLDSGEITGGMKPKLESALAALRGGTRSVHLVDGRVRHNVIAELFTDSGVGTLIRGE